MKHVRHIPEVANCNSSRGQPTRGGPPAGGLGEVVTTLSVKTHVK
jgi:hypothetical protein